jgi:hypothetical protein
LIGEDFKFEARAEHSAGINPKQISMPKKPISPTEALRNSYLDEGVKSKISLRIVIPAPIFMG